MKPSLDIGGVSPHEFTLFVILLFLAWIVSMGSTAPPRRDSLPRYVPEPEDEARISSIYRDHGLDGLRRESRNESPERVIALLDWVTWRAVGEAYPILVASISDTRRGVRSAAIARLRTLDSRALRRFVGDLRRQAQREPDAELRRRLEDLFHYALRGAP